MKLVLLLLSFLFSPDSSAKILDWQKAPVPAAHGMYIGPRGRVWFADTFHKLNPVSHIYNAEGEIVKTAPFGVGLGGIAKHPTKSLFSFCDTMGSLIHWLDGHGRHVASFKVSEPWNARWTPSGDKMWVVSYRGEVFELAADGESREILSDLDAPFDLAPVSDSRFWLSEQGSHGRSGRVCLFDGSKPKPQKIVCNRGVELSNPEGLWPLADGSVLAVDTEAGLLLRIAANGSSEVLEKNLGLPILVQALKEDRWVVFTNQSNSGAAVVYGQSPVLRCSYTLH